jgi:hypothetical protein
MVQDLFDDPSEDFLTNAEEILYLLGAPEWCHMYAEDEVLLLATTVPRAVTSCT